jgi:hypothetical protein
LAHEANELVFVNALIVRLAIGLVILLRSGEESVNEDRQLSVVVSLLWRPCARALMRR